MLPFNTEGQFCRMTTSAFTIRSVLKGLWQNSRVEGAGRLQRRADCDVGRQQSQCIRLGSTPIDEQE